MSPMCESCQRIVDPLNALISSVSQDAQLIVIMRADEQACRAFRSVFPLRMPVVCDEDRRITMQFDMHHNPSGLLYDEHHTLISKGVITDDESLAALLGDKQALAKGRVSVYSVPIAEACASTEVYP